MSDLDRQFIFIDRGESGDDPVAVGPFTTEDQAMTAGRGRDVLALWSFSTFMDEQAALDKMHSDEDDQYDATCAHCSRAFGSATGLDESGSQRCDDLDPEHREHRA